MVQLVKMAVLKSMIKQYVIHMFAQSLTADTTTTVDAFYYFKQDVLIIL